MFSARSRCSRQMGRGACREDGHVSPYHPSRLERAEVDRSRLRLRASDQASPAAHVSSDDQTAVTFLAEVAEDISQRIAESFFLTTLCFSARNPRCSLRDPAVLGERLSAPPREIDPSVHIIHRAWSEPKLIFPTRRSSDLTKHRRPPTFPATIKLP